MPYKYIHKNLGSVPKLILCKPNFTFILKRKSLLNDVRSSGMLLLCNIPLPYSAKSEKTKGLGGRMEKRKLVICIITTKLKSLKSPLHREMKGPQK